MLKKTIYRDYQEQQAADHNADNAAVRETFDLLVGDAITASRRFAGFAVIKSAQAEVQVAPGRFYDAGGAVYARRAAVTQSMLPYLAAAAKRYVLVSATGAEVETDQTERDFVINVETMQTEPQSVPMTLSREATLTFTQGAESGDPQLPAIPQTHVAIAKILLDTTQVISIVMLEDNMVESSEHLDLRAASLEAFRAAIEPRVNSLGSDLASLANQMRTRGDRRAIVELFQDVARIKERLEMPDTAADYGADRFLTPDESDKNNAANLGYNCKIEEGIRFADANADVFEMSLFSANDPNASLTGGLLLPKFDHALKLSIPTYHSDLGIAQYGFQTFDLTQLTMSRQRLRYGTVFTVCTNGNWWKTGQWDPVSNTFQRDGETFEVLDINLDINSEAPLEHNAVRMRRVWTDTYQEPYWAYVPVDHNITGAQVAQTFLISNDMWLSRVGFYLTTKAANEAVHLTVCEVTNGMPDHSRVVLQQTVPHGALLVNQWTRVAVQPTFLKAGKRYALLLTSNANHRVGMASGQQYLDGTFFYSTDGAYYQGDLTKDLMIELWGARFASSQVTIEMAAINLDGGIRSIDLLADMIVPKSTHLVFEVQPAGAGAWRPLTESDLEALTATPPLMRFRARFVGTRDIHPGVRLTGSRVAVSRPKTTFTHVSTPITLAAPSSEIYVELLSEEFEEVPHDLNCTLRVGAVTETADVTTTVALPNLPNVRNRIKRTFRFNTAAPATTFRIVITGSTNSAANTFHVSERVHYAV